MMDKTVLLELEAFIEQSLNLQTMNNYHGDVYSTEEQQFDMLEDFIEKKRKPRFAEVLFGFIDRINANDADVYKKAGIDRRHFSKIRSKTNYHPSKNTVIALALALNLNRNDFDYLLACAGYSLTDHDTFDLIIQFCIEKNIYELNDVNEALALFHLDPLKN